MSICPIMSRPTVSIVQKDNSKEYEKIINSETLIECLQHRCEFWVTVYTTEGSPREGCCKSFMPNMVEGHFRV